MSEIIVAQIHVGESAGGVGAPALAGESRDSNPAAGSRTVIEDTLEKLVEKLVTVY
jgi:hypothetical protein